VYKWDHLYKIERIKGWIIIYSNNQEARVLPTNKLDKKSFEDLLKFIRANATFWNVKIKI